LLDSLAKFILSYINNAYRENFGDFMNRELTKNLKVFAFILLTSALLVVAISPVITTIVKAQGTSTVVVLPSAGAGSTVPAAGTYSYAAGTDANFTATGSLVQWVVVDTTNATNFYTDNPLIITVAGGVNYTVQAEFGASVTPAGTTYYLYPATLSTASTNAVVVIYAANGGTTSPAPGTYLLADASNFDITAIADSGWTFSNWIIAGSPLTHGAYAFTDTPTNNPYNVNHGYGNTYSYEAVFTPISTTTSPMPTPTKINEFSSASAVAVVAALIAVLAAAGAYAYRKRK